jgi:hypothetical protein
MMRTISWSGATGSKRWGRGRLSSSDQPAAGLNDADRGQVDMTVDRGVTRQPAIPLPMRKGPTTTVISPDGASPDGAADCRQRAASRGWLAGPAQNRGERLDKATA